MRWAAVWASAIWLSMEPLALAGQRRGAPPPQVPKEVTTDATCAAELGTGLKTRRRFCDVVITATPAESVVLKIPAHTGTATLEFDLHNRFDVSTRLFQPIRFSRRLATIAVTRSTGTAIEKAAVLGTFRVAADAFDRVEGGTAPGNVKTVAPGPPEPIRITIPAGVSSVGVVGVKLRETLGTGLTEVFETIGRPIAVVSNWRIQYTPAK